MRLHQLIFGAQVEEMALQLDEDLLAGLLYPLFVGHVGFGREETDVFARLQHIAGERVNQVNALDLIAKHLDAHGAVFRPRHDLDDVAPHPKAAAL